MDMKFLLWLIILTYISIQLDSMQIFYLEIN